MAERHSGPDTDILVQRSELLGMPQRESWFRHSTIAGRIAIAVLWGGLSACQARGASESVERDCMTLAPITTHEGISASITREDPEVAQGRILITPQRMFYEPRTAMVGPGSNASGWIVVRRVADAPAIPAGEAEDRVNPYLVSGDAPVDIDYLFYNGIQRDTMARFSVMVNAESLPVTVNGETRTHWDVGIAAHEEYAFRLRLEGLETGVYQVIVNLVSDQGVFTDQWDQVLQLAPLSRNDRTELWVDIAEAPDSLAQQDTIERLLAMNGRLTSIDITDLVDGEQRVSVRVDAKAGEPLCLSADFFFRQNEQDQTVLPWSTLIDYQVVVFLDDLPFATGTLSLDSLEKRRSLQFEIDAPSTPGEYGLLISADVVPTMSALSLDGQSTSWISRYSQRDQLVPAHSLAMSVPRYTLTLSPCCGDPTHGLPSTNAMSLALRLLFSAVITGSVVACQQQGPPLPRTPTRVNLRSTIVNRPFATYPLDEILPTLSQDRSASRLRRGIG